MMRKRRYSSTVLNHCLPFHSTTVSIARINAVHGVCSCLTLQTKQNALQQADFHEPVRCWLSSFTCVIQPCKLHLKQPSLCYSNICSGVSTMQLVTCEAVLEEKAEQKDWFWPRRALFGRWIPSYEAWGKDEVIYMYARAGTEIAAAVKLNLASSWAALPTH